MSTLTVVRHGQASFLADDYDKLSPLGEQQARLLGEYWLARGVRFDRVVYGPCERQIRTGEIAGDVFRRAGAGWPETSVRPEFDEYPAEAVGKALLPVLSQRHPHIAEALQALRSAGSMDAKIRAFDKVLREVSLRWLDEEVPHNGLSTWGDFCTRIEQGVECIRGENGRGTRTVLFTSAGPVAATARLALELTPRATMELMWSPRNASVSEFVYTVGRFSMSTFNATPHLDASELLTYR
jgi:broad specificity phosphatase PhoE